MEEIEVLSCIRGYHIYKDVWTAAVGETLVSQREPDCPRTLLTDKFIRVKNFHTLSLKRNLFTDEKKANYGIYIIIYIYIYIYIYI